MKVQVQIYSIIQHIAYKEQFMVSFTNGLKAKVKDPSVAKCVVDLICFDSEASQKVFDVTLFQESVDMIWLESVELVHC